MCLLVIVVIGASDPLGVHSQWIDGGQGVNSFTLFSVGFFMAVGFGCFALFGRPRVEIDMHIIVLPNVWHDVTIPWSQIELTDTESSRYLRIRAEGNWYTVWGAEKTNFSTVLGQRGMPGKIVDAFPKDGSEVTNEGNVKSVRRKPEYVELVFGALWIIYLALGIAGFSI
jgi:hypothetical protein